MWRKKKLTSDENVISRFWAEFEEEGRWLAGLEQIFGLTIDINEENDDVEDVA